MGPRTARVLAALLVVAAALAVAAAAAPLAGSIHAPRGALFLDLLWNALTSLADALREGFQKLISYLINAFLYAFAFVFSLAAYVAILGLSLLARFFGWLIDNFITMLLWTPLINAGFAPWLWGATGDCTGGLDMYWGVEKYTLDQPALSNTLGAMWSAATSLAIVFLIIGTILALALNRANNISKAISTAVGIIFSADIYNFLAVLSLAIARLIYQLFVTKVGGLTGFWDAIQAVYQAFLSASITSGPLNPLNWPWDNIQAGAAFTGTSIFLLLISIFAILLTLAVAVYVAVTVLLTVVGRIFGLIIALVFLPISKAVDGLKQVLSLGNKNTISMNVEELGGMLGKFANKIVDFFSNIESEITNILSMNISVGILFGLLGIFTIIGLLALGSTVATSVESMSDRFDVIGPSLQPVYTLQQYDFGCNMTETMNTTAFMLALTFVDKYNGTTYQFLRSEGSTYTYDSGALSAVFSIVMGDISVSDMGGSDAWSWSDKANAYLQFNISLAMILLLFGVGQLLVIRQFVTTISSTSGGGFNLKNIISDLRTIGTNVFMATAFSIAGIGGLMLGFLGGGLARGLSALGARAATRATRYTGFAATALSRLGTALTAAGQRIGTGSTRFWKYTTRKTFEYFKTPQEKIIGEGIGKYISSLAKQHGFSSEYSSIKKYLAGEKYAGILDRINRSGQERLLGFITKREEKLARYLEEKYGISKEAADAVRRLKYENLYEQAMKLEKDMTSANPFKRILARRRFKQVRDEIIRNFTTEEELLEAEEMKKEIYEHYRDILGKEKAAELAEEVVNSILYQHAKRRAKEYGEMVKGLRGKLVGYDLITRMDKIAKKVKRNPRLAEKYGKVIDYVPAALSDTAERVAREVSGIGFEPGREPAAVAALANVAEKYGFTDKAKQLRDLVARGRDAVVAELYSRGLRALAEQKGIDPNLPLGELKKRLAEAGVGDEEILRAGYNQLAAELEADAAGVVREARRLAEEYKRYVEAGDYVAAEKTLRKLDELVRPRKGVAKIAFAEISKRVKEYEDKAKSKYSLDELKANALSYAETYRRLKDYAFTKPEDVLEGRVNPSELADIPGTAYDYGLAAPAVYAARYVKYGDVGELVNSIEAEVDRLRNQKTARGEAVELDKLYEEVIRRYAAKTPDIKKIAYIPEARVFAERLPAITAKAAAATGDQRFREVYQKWAFGDISAEQAAEEFKKLVEEHGDRLPRDVRDVLASPELGLLLAAADIKAPARIIKASRRVVGAAPETGRVDVEVVPRVDKTVRRGGLSVHGVGVVAGEEAAAAGEPAAKTVSVGVGRNGAVAVRGAEPIVEEAGAEELARTGYRVERKLLFNTVPVTVVSKSGRTWVYVEPVKIPEEAKKKRVRSVDKAAEAREDVVLYAKKSDADKIARELEERGARVIRGENGIIAVFPNGHRVYVTYSPATKEIRPRVEAAEPVEEVYRVHIPVVIERDRPEKIVVGRAAGGVGVEGPVKPEPGKTPDQVPGTPVAEAEVGPVKVVVKRDEEGRLRAAAAARAPEKGRRARSPETAAKLARRRDVDVVVLPGNVAPEERRRVLEELAKKVGGKPVFFGDKGVYIERSDGSGVWLVYQDSLGKVLPADVSDRVEEKIREMAVNVTEQAGYVARDGTIVLREVDEEKARRVAEKYAGEGDVYVHGGVVEVAVPPEKYGEYAEAAVRTGEPVVAADKIVRLDEGVPVIIRPRGAPRVEETGSNDTVAAVAAIAGELAAPTIAAVKSGRVAAWRAPEAPENEVAGAEKIVVSRSALERPDAREKLNTILRMLAERKRAVDLVLAEPLGREIYVQEIHLTPELIAGAENPLELVRRLAATTPAQKIDAASLVEESEVPVRSLIIYKALEKIEPGLAAQLRGQLGAVDLKQVLAEKGYAVVEAREDKDIEKTLRTVRLVKPGDKIIVLAREDVGETLKPVLEAEGLDELARYRVNGDTIIVFGGTKRVRRIKQQQQQQEQGQEGGAGTGENTGAGNKGNRGGGVPPIFKKIRKQ